MDFEAEILKTTPESLKKHRRRYLESPLKVHQLPSQSKFWKKMRKRYERQAMNMLLGKAQESQDVVIKWLNGLIVSPVKTLNGSLLCSKLNGVKSDLRFFVADLIRHRLPDNNFTGTTVFHLRKGGVTKVDIC